MSRLAGKCALITGAARGIGAEFARAYVDEGARVAIADINIERARETAEALGPSAIAVQMDVTRQDSIDSAVAETVAMLGRIDVLINNAALFTAAPLVEITREDYARVFDINVGGVLFTMQAVARHMIEHGIKGRIINMASQAGRRGEPLVAGPTGRIPAGCYFVATDHPDGFDSRYAAIGWICRDRLIGIGRPIL